MHVQRKSVMPQPMRWLFQFLGSIGLISPPQLPQHRQHGTQTATRIMTMNRTMPTAKQMTNPIH
jgi:hypothetical protein